MRLLRRSPGFTAAAVPTLTLGVGANTAIFGVVHQTLVRPLRFEAPEQLVRVGTQAVRRALPVAPGQRQRLSRIPAIEHVLRWAGSASGLEPQPDGREPERLYGVGSRRTTSMLGVRPFLGRDFAAGEEVEGADAVALISCALWQRRFGGDPAIVNRPIMLDGRAHNVIGVMPADLMFPSGRQLDPLITFGPCVDVHPDPVRLGPTV